MNIDQQQSKNQDFLALFATGLSQLTDPEKLLGYALDSLTDSGPLPEESVLSVFLLDSQTQSLLLSAIKDHGSMLPACGRGICLGECICGAAAESRDLVYLPANEKTKENSCCSDERDDSHGDLAIPLATGKGRLVGVLHVGFPGDVLLSQEILDVLQLAGKMLADAVDRSLTYKAMIDWNLDLRRRAESQQKTIHELRIALAHAKRAKSDFLSSMSHELRTPLNAIIGFSQVLQEEYFGKINSKQREYISDVLDSGKHLLELINDILDLSKVEAGMMELELSKVHVASLLEGSLDMIREKAHKHGVTLSVDIPDEVCELMIMADERKLKQVIFNLLSNASKFTPDGGSICVGARIVNDPVGDNKGNASGLEALGAVMIFVQDDGVGVDISDQKKIFEDFYQVARGLSGKTPGTGLGLPLSKRLVALHQGLIWLESEGKGLGSKFCFIVPIGICPLPEASRMPESLTL